MHEPDLLIGSHPDSQTLTGFKVKRMVDAIGSTRKIEFIFLGQGSDRSHIHQMCLSFFRPFQFIARGMVVQFHFLDLPGDLLGENQVRSIHGSSLADLNICLFPVLFPAGHYVER